MIDGSSAYKLIEYDYLADTDPISGAPTVVSVPKTVTEARDALPYNTIASLDELFLRENIRTAWRLLRKNDPYDYQLEVADAIIYSALQGLGWFIVVMISRQAGKNEISAFVQHYLLLYGWYHGERISGVKFAPVHKPQVQASMDRLEGADAPDAGGMAGSILTKRTFTKSDGYKYHIGKPRDSNKWAFLSINPTANVASQTAFTLLEGDEAQDIDEAKWNRDAQPMGSFNNATTVLYGVAWTKGSFIYQGMQQAYDMEARLEPKLGYRPKLVFKIDADRVIAAGNANYKEFYENLVARLGENHIAVQTQYRLTFVDTIGKYFSDEEIARIFASLYETRQGPKPGSSYIFSIDVAGQEEQPTELADEVEAGNHKRDATILTIGELFPDGVVVPVAWYQWVGKGHTQQRLQIKTILKHWNCTGGSGDATGLGEALIYWLIEQMPEMEIEAYKFKAAGDENKSKLGYLAYSYVKGGLFRMPRRPADNPQQADLYDEARWQLENLVRVAKKEQKINFHVPHTAKPRREGHVPHDDVAIGLFLLIRAAYMIKDPEGRKASAYNRDDIGG
ncbi:terminase [Paenibacillus sp. L3-i20]|uniref:terminase n=1 Tax=Paenibacillus sp. L3-i20 TaxID=2905833 RepID=UPI001EE128BB|nr:terminase [Paenibacillus sp. L3-i20]GKU79302.1 hypothetical protein L3i20_v236990 [Paenibacillus sp. L3-i20]